MCSVLLEQAEVGELVTGGARLAATSTSSHGLPAACDSIPWGGKPMQDVEPHSCAGASTWDLQQSSPALEQVPITTRIQVRPCAAAPHMLKHHPQLAQGTALLSHSPGTPCTLLEQPVAGRDTSPDTGHHSEPHVLPSSALVHPAWLPTLRGCRCPAPYSRSAGSHMLPPGR